MKILIERAKDNNLTCKIKDNEGKITYIYSKYRPKNIKKIELKKEKNYLILGLGLGYEVYFVAKNTDAKVYVIEPNKDFYDIISSQDDLNSIFDLSNISYVFGNDFEKLSNLDEFEIIINQNLTLYNRKFYENVISSINNKKKYVKSKEKIVLLDNDNIIEDCKEALLNLDYDVDIISYNSNVDKFRLTVLKSNPKYMISINFNPTISKVCADLNIKYISWCVDTPLYTIFKKEIMNKNNYIFLYDKVVVNNFRNKGIKNIYYMPVAVNCDRLDNIEITDIEKNLYSSDISFIANLTLSEYRLYIKNYLSDKTSSIIDEIFEIQNNDIQKFHIKDYCTMELINRIEAESNYKIESDDFLKREEKLAFLLGREQSFIERINYINKIEMNFSNKDFKVFGNDVWSGYTKNYCGYVDYYKDMPKVMQLSKINLNIARTFVEGGLPIRIFDVLGSKGFLVTNYKEGLLDNFNINKDFVVYRDLKDLIEIIDYYLEHDNERIEIARNGYEKVKEHHNYEKRLKSIMKIVNS